MINRDNAICHSELVGQNSWSSTVDHLTVGISLAKTFVEIARSEYHSGSVARGATSLYHAQKALEGALAFLPRAAELSSEQVHWVRAEISSLETVIRELGERHAAQVILLDDARCQRNRLSGLAG